MVRGQEEDAAFGEEALEEKGELPEAVGEAFGVAVGGEVQGPVLQDHEVKGPGQGRRLGPRPVGVLPEAGEKGQGVAQGEEGKAREAGRLGEGGEEEPFPSVARLR